MCSAFVTTLQALLDLNRSTSALRFLHFSRIWVRIRHLTVSCDFEFSNPCKNQEPKYEMIFIKVYTCTNIHSNFRKCPEEAYSVRKGSTRHCEWEANLERKMSNWKCWSRNVKETCSNENWKSTSTTLHELVIWSSCDFLRTFQSSKAYF